MPKSNPYWCPSPIPIVWPPLDSAYIRVTERGQEIIPVGRRRRMERKRLRWMGMGMEHRRRCVALEEAAAGGYGEPSPDGDGLGSPPSLVRSRGQTSVGAGSCVAAAAGDRGGFREGGGVYCVGSFLMAHLLGVRHKNMYSNGAPPSGAPSESFFR